MKPHLLIYLAMALSALGEPEGGRCYVPTTFENNIFHIEAGEKGLRMLKLLKALYLIKKEDWKDAEPILVDSEGNHGRKSYTFEVKNKDLVEVVTLSGASSSIQNGEPIIDRIEVTRRDRNVFLKLDKGKYVIESISDARDAK